MRPFDYLTQTEQKLFICIKFDASNTEDIPVLIKATSLKLAFICQRLP